MKFETFLKSAMIIGLLAGVTDVNAAKSIKNAVGKDIHCPDVTINNNSDSPTYDLQVIYSPCGHPEHRTSIPPVKPGKVGVIPDGIHPETEVRIDQIQPGKSTTPNLWNRAEISEDLTINCIGNSGNPDCSPEAQKSPVQKSTKK